MILNELEWLSGIFDVTKHHAASRHLVYSVVGLVFVDDIVCMYNRSYFSVRQESLHPFVTQSIISLPPQLFQIYCNVTVVSNKPFSHGTGTLRCLQKEMATYRHWSVSAKQSGWLQNLWTGAGTCVHCTNTCPRYQPLWPATWSMQRLIDTWASISQNVINKAIGQCRIALRASMKTKWHHFKHLLN